MWQTIDHKTVPAMATAFRLGMLDRQANTTLVARLDGHISGVLTMTRWPHCQFSWGEMVITAPRLFFAYHTNLFRSFQAYNMLERHDPHQPHWHIAAVGVLPALQGIGIGTRLLEACCAIVDSTGLPAYLETDLFVNTRLYGRFDFDIKEKVEVFGVTNWLMWRAPRTSPKPVASVAKDPILVA
jgi:GNAT superfamily N-acetyltransferase